MANTKKGINIGANVGTSSLLLVFVILCLVSFATLSIVSAKANKKLNDKVVDRSNAYYEACNLANEKLMNIDQTLFDLYSSGLSREEYFAQAGDTIDFIVPVSDLQSLQVSADVNYPTNPGDSFYSITCWSLRTTGSLEVDDTLELMNFDEQ